MDGIVYVNGEYLDAADAKISVFDRGFLFADGVYEVSAVINRRLVDNEAHLARLTRSLRELDMESPVSNEEITSIQEKLIAKNQLKEGIVYLQITRGAAPRSFIYPADAEPSLVIFTQATALIHSENAARGIRVITVQDIRWGRRDIKTVGLLGASMAKQTAVTHGADDAWMHEEGFITEGSSNNAYILKASGELVTRHLGHEILAGITRAAVLELCRRENISVVERPFSVQEAYDAQEAFVTSASTFVYPVIQIDDQVIGTGAPGPIATRLRGLYIQMALND